MKFTPIFQQGDRFFVVPTPSLVGDDKEDAFKIAMGTLLVEGVILNFKFAGDYLELRDDGTASVKGWHAKLGAWEVVVLEREKP